MQPKLGIIAGGGDLPKLLISACRSRKRDFFVVALEGFTDPATVVDTPHVWLRLGAVGKGIDRLHQADVGQLVLAGHVKRPSLAQLRPDSRGARLLARVSRNALGDDGLLSAVVHELENEGFTVVGADSLLDGLLAPAGVLGRVAPDASAQNSIARGFEVARRLGALDVGQAVVVQDGVVLGVEAIEGTAALIERCGHLRLPEETGPVLVKAVKPNQERRVDLPSIGVDTVEQAAGAGFQGIAVQAQSTLIIDREAVVAAADLAGLFLVGRTIEA